MFDSELGGQISWLLPVALAGLVAGLWLTRRHRRTTASAPASCCGAARSSCIWRSTTTRSHLPPVLHRRDGAGCRRPRRRGRGRALAPRTTVAPLGLGAPGRHRGTALWADTLLARSSGYDSWVGPTVVVTGVVSALVLFLCLARPRVPGWFAVAAGSVAAMSLLAGPAAYSLTTLGTTTNGIATAGPTSSAGGPAGGNLAPSAAPTGTHAGGFPGTTTRTGGAPTGARTGAGVTGAGGGGGASTANTALVRYLERHQGSAEYLVAVNGSQTAAPFILESGKAVIAMGGFTGTDPTPTMSEFEHLVATGKVHYVYVSSGAGGGGTPGAGGGTPPGGTAAGTLSTSTGTRAGHRTGRGGRSGGFGGTRGGGQTASTTSAVDSWVAKHGTVVSSSAYGGSSGGGTLYYVSSSAAE